MHPSHSRVTPPTTTRWIRCRPKAWPWLSALGLALACSSARKSPQVPGPKITEVQIEGRAELSEAEILEHISLRPSRWWDQSFYYFPGSKKATRERIAELFRAEGYYDVRVAPIQVKVTRQERPLKKQRAAVLIVIQAGAPTLIRAITWTRNFPSDQPPPKLSVSLAEAAKLKVKQRFSTSKFNRAKAQLETAIKDEGYPDVKVQESAIVDKRARSAKLHFEIDFGYPATIASVSVEGTSGIPQRFVHRLAEDSIGQRYAPKRLAALESSIYGLGIFSSVHFTLRDTKVPTQKHLHIEVIPRDPSQLAVGLTADFDSTIWSQRLGLRYRHNNLFNGLSQLNLRVAGGWAEMPTTAGKWHSSPLAELDAHLSKPSLRFRHLRWFMQLGGVTQPREGYEFWRVDGKIGAIRNFGRHSSLSLSYNASIFDIYTFASDRKATATGIDALEGQRPFLSFIEAQAQVFHLDQRPSPKQGVHGLLTYHWASRWLGSHSEYHRISPEIRGYWNPISWLVLAARTRVGFILPFGQRPGARFDQRFYLGGVGSMRGWPLRTLSPYVTLCDSKNVCKPIPIGGNSEFLANLEFRFNVWKALDLVTFGDTGDVQKAVFTIRPRDFMYTLGTGLRYVTPIGAIRFDVGFQLNHDLRRFTKTRPFALHLSLGDSF